MTPDEIETLRKSIAIVPKVGGFLSLIACTAIIRDVFIKWRRKKHISLSSVIVFCITVADWLFSLFCPFLSTWMMPANSWAYLASGTDQTCTAQGFIKTFTTVASMGYYAELMILFWTTVRFDLTESYTSKVKIQLSFVLPPIVVALGIAIPPVPLQMYNEARHYSCAINAFPNGCEYKRKVDCVRGEGAWDYWYVFVAFSMICNIIIIGSVVLLTWSVYNQERKTDKYLTRGQERMRESTTKTFWQGIRYILAYMLAYIPLYMFAYYRLVLRWPPAVVWYLNITLTPLLGVFLSFAYFRHRYLTFRKINPEATLIASLSNVFNIDIDYHRSSTEGDLSNDLERVLASPLLEHTEQST
ncbi:hypothetical protein ACHAWF_014964 [Thalassiosira exigua]